MTLVRETGRSVRELVNSRSRNLKDLGVDYTALSDQEIASLLSMHPKTMIRPLYRYKDSLVVGYQPGELDSLID